LFTFTLTFMRYDTPILFLIFNRPDVTFKVFERIREQQPENLFIAADGARNNRPGELELCLETRSIIQKIDWQCNVRILFRDENLGCSKGVSGAISWFFSQVEYGIILEDDCLPDLSFFSFCKELLLKYNTEQRIGAICGFNSQLGISRTNKSYYFARLHSSWGWATWADRWCKYNENDFPEEKVLNDAAIKGWKEEISDTFLGKIDSWAYRWQYVFRKNDFICIYPNVSLIRNIGFSENASNTTGIRWWYKHIKYGAVPIIHHPNSVNISEDADRLTMQLNKALPLSWKNRIKRKLIKFIK